MKYFKASEFDCKSLPGSGRHMDFNFLVMIDHARTLAGVPFVINSGYRTKAYNQALIKRGEPASPDSSHMKGIAADIAVSPQNRTRVIDACIEAGFKRIGVANSFIHVDIDKDKASPAVWGYSTTDPAYLASVRKKMGL
jgi:zinc D-Ala-D-Ala carboxypeptidase